VVLDLLVHLQFGVALPEQRLEPNQQSAEGWHGRISGVGTVETVETVGTVGAVETVETVSQTDRRTDG